MTKRTLPDKNQTDIAECVNLSPGCRFVDTHNVPANLPELTGFPDGLIINENALTIICQDPRQVKAALEHLPGVKVLEGAVIQVEIKTEDGKLRKSQTEWGQQYGVEPVVLRNREAVFKLLGAEVIG